MGKDIETDNDLLAVLTKGRMAHVHLHPSAAIKRISFDYIYNGVRWKAQSGPPIPKDNGIDNADRAQSHFSIMSAVVDGTNVYFFNPTSIQIRFNRLTRKYEL